jgi:hypothetical protein
MKKLFVLMLMLGVASTASASIDWLTSAASSDWFDAANWSNGVPSLTNLTNTRTYQTHANTSFMPIIQAGQVAEVYQLDIGGERAADGGVPAAVVTVNAGGTLHTGDYLRIGSSSSSVRDGDLVLNNATLICDNYMAVGYGTGTADVTGRLFANGATINVTNEVRFGNAAGTSGEAYLTGGTILTAASISWRPAGTSGTPTTLLDIINSTVILTGDQYQAVIDAIDMGYIKSNGVDLDYGFVNFDGTNTIITPEPATLCLLGLGALSLIRRKK